MQVEGTAEGLQPHRGVLGIPCALSNRAVVGVAKVWVYVGLQHAFLNNLRPTKFSPTEEALCIARCCLFPLPSLRCGCLQSLRFRLLLGGVQAQQRIWANQVKRRLTTYVIMKTVEAGLN